jgi:hypothetical protein
MGTDSGRAVFGPLIEQAKTGAVALKADPQAFLELDKALDKRKNDIQAVQQIVRQVHDHPTWGLGEQATVLTSAHTIVQRFRDKGADGANNAYDTLQDHWQAADELQTLFRTIREQLQQTDADFAARFRTAQTRAGQPPASTGV